VNTYFKQSVFYLYCDPRHYEGALAMET